MFGVFIEQTAEDWKTQLSKIRSSRDTGVLQKKIYTTRIKDRFVSKNIILFIKFAAGTASQNVYIILVVSNDNKTIYVLFCPFKRTLLSEESADQIAL